MRRFFRTFAGVLPPQVTNRSHLSFLFFWGTLFQPPGSFLPAFCGSLGPAELVGAQAAQQEPGSLLPGQRRGHHKCGEKQRASDAAASEARSFRWAERTAGCGTRTCAVMHARASSGPGTGGGDGEEPCARRGVWPFKTHQPMGRGMLGAGRPWERPCRGAGGRREGGRKSTKKGRIEERSKEERLEEEVKSVRRCPTCKNKKGVS